MNQVQAGKPKGIPRIESLRVENYRALRQVALLNRTPMTVLLGPNGSGKSTVFDIFNFLYECFQFGLRHAWDRRGRAKELKSRGAVGSGEALTGDLGRLVVNAPLIGILLAADS